jgi:hypothetical protein
MNGQTLTQWLALAANGGVLVGLLLVLLQLRQNRDLMRAQIRHELAEGIVELLATVASNPQLAGVLRRGALGESLTDDERFQFEFRTNALLRYWENVHYQFRHGLYDQVEYASQKAAFKATLASSVGLVAYWQQTRALYSPRFAAELDGLLPAAPADTRREVPAQVA